MTVTTDRIAAEVDARLHRDLSRKSQRVPVDALQPVDREINFLQLGLLEEGVGANSLDEVVVEEHGLDVVGNVLRSDILDLVKAGVDEGQLRFGLY